MKFKKGDKVRVLNKTLGDSLDDTNFKKGDILYVRQFDYYNKKACYCNDGGRNRGLFKESDLELVERIKYKKGKRDLKIIDIIKSSDPTREEQNNFTKNMTNRGYKLHDTIKIDDWFIDYVLDRSECFIDWLTRNQYIEAEIFKPFYLILKIKSEEELMSIWHRFNLMPKHINFSEYDKNSRTHGSAGEDYISTKIDMYRFWKGVDKKAEEMGLI